MRSPITRLTTAAAIALSLIAVSAAPAQASVPRSYSNALAQASSYVRVLDISKEGLYDQLHSRYGGKFSAKAARYAVNHVKANWNHEARDSGQAYIRALDISKAGLRDQLTSENGAQFTRSQATYALNHVKVNYNKEALGAARAYDKLFHMSDDALFDQLTSENGAQFTASQARYAIARL